MTTPGSLTLRPPAIRNEPKPDDLRSFLGLVHVQHQADSFLVQLLDRLIKLGIIKANTPTSDILCHIRRMLGFRNTKHAQNHLRVRPLWEIQNSLFGPIPHVVLSTNTHSGTATRNFKDWRVFAKYLPNGPDVDPHIDSILAGLNKFCAGPFTIACADAAAVSTEADYNDHVGNRLLPVCVESFNRYIPIWYKHNPTATPRCPTIYTTTRPFVKSLDENERQYDKLMMYTDHAIAMDTMADSGHGELETIYLLTTEEKAPGTIIFKDMKHFKGTNGAIVKNVGGNLAEHLAQLLKYHDGYKCDAAIFGDGTGKEYAFEWEIIREGPEKSSHEPWRHLKYWKLEVKTGTNRRTAYTSVNYLIAKELVRRGYFPKSASSTSGTGKPAGKSTKTAKQ
ncbi:hypothetical protein EXIGLDRAFT_728692 [Exidia glandulosa HHB12029]|uniref:Uncharacterized protein n=1 Tax=Exidia glandulosa HHB12029 TaxID=1314781 RepID=A0A166B678_EXIGL|nr:hypothetical protein EXIGLDRAFT_728692 [Exidia glandulosa HHB12029]